MPNCREPANSGFTLTELLVVMVIIATLITVVAPYATRSNQGLSLEQECLNLAEAARFAMQCAADRHCPTRLVVDRKRRAYRVEIALDPGRQEFQPLERPPGLQHTLPPGVQIYSLDGFTPTGSDSHVVFDPTTDWPAADVSLQAGTTVEKVLIRGKRIDFAQEPM